METVLNKHTPGSVNEVDFDKNFPVRFEAMSITLLIY